MIEIRELSPEYADAISEILRDVCSERLSAEAVRAKLENPVYVAGGAFEGDNLAGFYAAFVADDADVWEIAVSPRYRRRGAARALIENLKSQAKSRGARNIFLEVRVSNAPAIALYLSTGFERVSTRKRYYPDGEDADIYRCVL